MLLRFVFPIRSARRRQKIQHMLLGLLRVDKAEGHFIRPFHRYHLNQGVYVFPILHRHKQSVVVHA